MTYRVTFAADAALVDTTDLTALAAEAYVYGFPLVFDLQQVDRFVRQGIGSLSPAPFNRFSHATALASPADRFVSINNDTLYSIAQLDLDAGPLLLRVPDAAGRYYVLQFVDAWTSNFAYVGRRATGTGAGSFLIAPPGWTGRGPGAARVIEAPTTVATIVGRWACAGPADQPAVHALQGELALDALDDRPVPPSGVPWPAAARPELGFFEQLRTWLRAFPPAAPDQAYQQRFAPLGLLDPEPPYADPPAELARALTAGVDTAKQRMDSALKSGDLAPEVNGWRFTVHSFDYNLDHLGPGTIDNPAWKMKDRRTSYLARALAARAGLWGNHGYEAAYPMTYTDADGDQLDGHHRYTLTFDQEPPVAAFWSITMYDLPDFYLVANPIDRYSIGDRTPGLRRDADGSLTILIQHEQPADTSNWLPAPAAPFRPLMRLYQPQQPILGGTYQLPPIRKAVS